MVAQEVCNSDTKVLPLMHSTYLFDQINTRCGSENGNKLLSRLTVLRDPRLSLSTQWVDFGDVSVEHIYVTSLTLFNCSVVPVRFRVRVPVEVQTCLSVKYNHQFLAAGMETVISL
uniref:Sperm-associated antigen 17 n=1 Tax=Lygus hesperus TaxID=30085 RepID=A0A0A9W332_LYGHE